MELTKENILAPERIAGGGVASLPEVNVGSVINGSGIAIFLRW